MASFRLPQTPLSALGLSQTLPRVAAQAQRDRNEELRRRKRVVLVVIVICSLVLLYEMAQWAIGGSMAASQREQTQRTVDELRLKRQQGEARLVQEQAKDASRSRSSKGFRNEKQIVMLLTNYRDSQACAQTLVEAHTLAHLPARIHFRVFDEVHIGVEDSCVKVFCDLRPTECRAMLRSKQLRYTMRDASSASGVTVAKHLVESMVTRKQFGGHFYMSVDPTVSFTKNWDLGLLKQWYSIGNDMAILSIAPKALELKDRVNNPSTMLLQCSARIHSKSIDAVVEYNPPEPRVKVKSALFAPVLQSQYTELFHFGPVSALLAIRSDPHTSHVTVGHEYARATRFWTNGYDFYAPTEDLVYATYTWRPSPSTFVKSDVLETEVQRSNRRIRRLLQLPVSSTKAEPLADEQLYALGSRRAMAQWESFSKVYPKAAYNESTTNQFVACNEQLKYVRYQI